MSILKRENWWIWLLLMFFSSGTSSFVLGALLGVYEKNTWYTKWYYWMIGLIFILPFTIMLTVFKIHIMDSFAAKFDVPGKELYLTPYLWILCIIIPVIGWILFLVMYLYLEIWNVVMLHRGSAEKYIG